MRKALRRKLIASGTSRFESTSYCAASVQRNSPAEMSSNERTRACDRYCPMSSIAAAATGCERSDVLHTMPTSRSSVSSTTPGHVLDAGSSTPRATPRTKFFCMSASLAT